MKFITTLTMLLLTATSFAQKQAGDSVAVAKVLTGLLQICREAELGGQNATKPCTFTKAARYIVYRGEDKSRRWKDFSDYTRENEKQHVDEICARINKTVNQDSRYQLLDYATNKESEGTWHTVTVAYSKNGEERRALFAFLFIKGRFVLGDIDWSGNR